VKGRLAAFVGEGARGMDYIRTAVSVAGSGASMACRRSTPLTRACFAQALAEAAAGDSGVQGGGLPEPRQCDGDVEWAAAGMSVESAVAALDQVDDGLADDREH
jgi:hypothetical protein